jgi:hypothetical protein
MLLLAVAGVFVLQALAGTATSPVERLLHVTAVPRWWPFVLAGLAGIIGGSLLSRGKTGSGTAGAPAKKAEVPATRGRRAVPRHVRRERERQERHQKAVERAAAREREAEEAVAAAAAAEAAAAQPVEQAPPRGLQGLRRWADGALGRRRSP